jgi:hypothetical protein
LAPSYFIGALVKKKNLSNCATDHKKVIKILIVTMLPRQRNKQRIPT